MDESPGTTNDVLARLVGDRMYSVEFVLNDYVQLRFDGNPGAGDPVVLNCYHWPVVRFGDREWTEHDLGYADALRKLTPGTVIRAMEGSGAGIRIDLDTGSVQVDPAPQAQSYEIAEMMGFHDGAWLVWRPGERVFAHSPHDEHPAP